MPESPEESHLKPEESHLIDKNAGVLVPRFRPMPQSVRWFSGRVREGGNPPNLRGRQGRAAQTREGRGAWTTWRALSISTAATDPPGGTGERRQEAVLHFVSSPGTQLGVPDKQGRGRGGHSVKAPSWRSDRGNRF